MTGLYGCCMHMGLSTPSALQDVSTLRWHSRHLLWHAHQCGHSKGRSMWRVTSNLSGLVATQIWVSTDETLLPCGSRPYCCHWGGTAIRIFSLSSLSFTLYTIYAHYHFYWMTNWTLNGYPLNAAISLDTFNVA